MLAIVTTHPIQYYAPIFRMLKKLGKVDFHVFYQAIPDSVSQGSAYGRSYEWDVDLLSGYPHASGKSVLLDLERGLREKRFHSLLLLGWQNSFMLRVHALAVVNGVPVMVRGDSHLHTPRSYWKKWAKEPVYRTFLQSFRVCLAVGTWNRDYYLHYGVADSHIIASPHCVDNDWFATRAKELWPRRLHLRQQWGFSIEHRVFLFVGRLSAMKRVGDFILALGMAVKIDPSIRGLIVGDGEQREELECLARDSQAPVCFTGFLNQTEITQAYVAADTLVLPSDGRETWGLVVNEGMACGLPCILSDQVGCGPDMILGGDTGFVYPCGDLEQLKDCLLASFSRNETVSGLRPLQERVLKNHSCVFAVNGILNGVEFCLF